jgi:cell division inhibitor SepF
MSLMDKFLNAMRLNEDDEDDYEFDNDEYLDDEAAEDTPAKKSVFKPKEKKEEKYEEPVREKPVKTAPKITPISKGSKKQGNGMGVRVIKPISVEDARDITEALLNGITVILNVEGLNVEIAQRIIDFASGSCFAISGNLQKISNYIFIISPAEVDISGDFQNLLDSFETTGFSY